MATQTGFHATFPTELDAEITLAENLYVAARLRHGERLSRLVRRDPAAVFRRFHYCRARCQAAGRMQPDEFATVIRGMDLAVESKAGNALILTPSVSAWREFSERLTAELMAPDAAWRFAPANRCHCGTSGLEYWPLASAELVRELGFAVAETLAVFLTFCAYNDHDVLDHVERIWWRVRPWRKRSANRRPGVNTPHGGDDATTTNGDR